MLKRSTTSAFGELLVSLGYVTRDQIREVESDGDRPDHRLGEELLAYGYIARDELQHALAVAAEEPSRAPDKPPLGRVLVELDHLAPARLEAMLDAQRLEHRPLGELLVDRGECTYRQVFDALTLQNIVASRTRPPGPPGPPAATPSNGVRVLVVDDSELVCRFVTEALHARGFEVVTLQDPHEALVCVTSLRPDLVVTDLEMPGMTGIELCSQLKARSAELPVIILTGNDTKAQPSIGLRAGADDYVRKSAPMEELAARIDSVMRRTAATERMRRLFARYTSDAIVDEVLRAGEVVLTGEQREVTVVFADIRDFTSVVESLPPARVMTALNDVLGRLADAVLGCGGTLDKFLGDGVMGVFGAPVAHDDDAQRAFAAARRMIGAVAERNRTGVEPMLEIGIGVNTGSVVAGSLGNERRTEYTCIGDPVNVAARLCALAAPGEILVGGATAERLDLRTLDRLPAVNLKGKSYPVDIYRARGELSLG
jgi:adenylate cyclase